VLNAFATSHFTQVEKWKDSRLQNRPREYYEYKARQSADIMTRLEKTYPQYRGRLKVIETSSMLTFRDYLHSPDGCAYGIKQKIAQYNLFGKLPIRNVYACGQSSVLPGIVGAMLSSFVVARAIVGKEEYGKFINSRINK
jgi:phytoene dehydrogenase-like protein